MPSEWKEDAVARRNIRQSRDGPEAARHRRRFKGCKKARDDQHVWGATEFFSLGFVGLSGPSPTEIGYSVQVCTLCGKKNWRSMNI